MSPTFSSPPPPPLATSDWVGEAVRLAGPETLVRRDEPLARHTTLRVGGPADLFIEPAAEEELGRLIAFCHGRGIAFFILGRGSNLLVRDGGFRGVVIRLSHPYFSRVELSGLRIVCGAGARLKAVAVEARRHALAGFEFLEGIPGSVGGALRMNAGAMGGATFDCVESVRVMDYDGVVADWPAARMEVGYRECGALRNRIALGARLAGSAGSRAAIGEKMASFSQKRWGSQPAAPSAGCAFKNPAQIPAGRLIEELGMKGARCGGASVSLEHGNFIVNDGTATARDVLDLIELIRGRAREARGIALELEVQIIGDPASRAVTPTPFEAGDPHE